MSRIAVVSALNVGNNGMYSVDLAADVFFRRLNQPFTPIVTQDRRRVGRLRFELLQRPEDFDGFDTVIFWGDFLNNPMWGRRDYARREVRLRKAVDPQHGFENWREIYLRLKRHHPSARILAVGGCFLGADENIEPSLRDDLADFLGTADLVAPRDARSLQILRSLSPNAKLEEGVDCAWLLPFAQPKKRKSNYFVYFFGRTLERAGHSWIDELSRRTGLRAVPVNWFNWPRWNFKMHRDFNCMHQRIAGAAFVVTDTYHLAINALNRQRRVVCLYDSGHKENGGSCADAKKPLLMHQVGLPQLLVDVSAEKSLAAAVFDRLQTVKDNDLEKSLAVFHRRCERFRQLIENALVGISPPANAVGGKEMEMAAAG